MLWASSLLGAKKKREKEEESSSCMQVAADCNNSIIECKETSHEEIVISYDEANSLLLCLRFKLEPMRQVCIALACSLLQEKEQILVLV